ncbi:MAG TPA: hypothetical protein PK156_13130 [Polyangium sp.]|nr:hypothetical protein [Polyangium sp.]
MTACKIIVRAALASLLICTPGQTRAEAKGAAVTAMAEALFKEGKKLLAEHRVAEACRKFESSYRIDPAPGALLNLALCHEQEGKMATAWGEFNESLQIAKKTNRPDRAKIAKEHISAIEPLLSRFVVVVPEDAKKIGIVVEMDGVPLEEGAWGSAIPIDAGEHKAIVRASKHKTWEKQVTVEHSKVATVVVPRLERLPDPVPPDPGGKWKKPVGFASLGAAAVMFGVGGYLGARAISLGGEVNQECPTLVCTAATWEKIDEGRNSALASNLLLGFGVAAAAAGTFFLITAPKTPKKDQTVANIDVRFSLGPGGQFIGIGGTW